MFIKVGLESLFMIILTKNVIGKKLKWNDLGCFLLFLLLMTLSIHAYAQETQAVKPSPTEKITAESVLRLEDLIKSAKEKSPGIVSAHAEWLAAKKRVWIDTSPPDPMAGFDLMGADRETRTGPEMGRFVVSQDIPFPVKLIEKGKMAREEARASYQRYKAMERGVINQLKKLYYELYYIDSSLQVIDEIKDLLKKFEGVAEARYSNMSGTQRDVAKAQAEVSMSLERLYTLTQERESVTAMINALLDRDPMLPVGKAILPERPAVKQSLVELVNLAVVNRQEIKEMEALAAKSQYAKTLAKLSYIPDLNIGFEYTQVGSGTTTDEMDGKDSWMFPIRFNVPIWQNRIIPEIQEAQKMAEAAKAKLLEAKNTTFYEVKDAYHRFLSSSQIADLYETAVIPQAKIALSADQAGYEAGKIDFLNLLDSERVYLNAKLTQTKLFTEALKSYTDLERATGLDLVQSEEK